MRVVEEINLGWCYDVRVELDDGRHHVFSFPERPANPLATAVAIVAAWPVVEEIELEITPE